MRNLKNAFTLLELIIVIVVVGIIASSFLTKKGRDPLAEATIELASAIRYTQHLAMIDDVYNSTSQWYKTRWQLILGQSASTNHKWTISIFSDKSKTGNPDLSELAKNPDNNGKLLSGGFSGILNWDDNKATRTYNLGLTYGITNVQSSHCNRGKRVAFDHVGRPFGGNDKNWQNKLDGLLTSTCTFILSANGVSKKGYVYIEPESGYVWYEIK